MEEYSLLPLLSTISALDTTTSILLALSLLLSLVLWLDHRSIGRSIQHNIANIFAKCISPLLIIFNHQKSSHSILIKNKNSINNNNNNNIHKENNNSKINGQAIGDDSIYSLPDAPSPLALPIIGHLYLLAKYPENPWQGFQAISDAYGPVVQLQLGQYRTILVSSIETIREVLLTRGDAFADRPHFDRHALIFGQDRQNALALCDWSDIHKTRRSIAHAAVIPRFGTKTFVRLRHCIEASVRRLLREIERETENSRKYTEFNFSSSPRSSPEPETIILRKERLVGMCAAIFIEFLLEKSDIDVHDAEFVDVCRRYDFVFHDINQMYLCDFLPWLAPITARRYRREVAENGDFLKKFINDQVSKRYQQLLAKRSEKVESQQPQNESHNNNAEDVARQYDDASCAERFVDRLLLHKQYQSSAPFLDFILNHYADNRANMTWNECLYEIGDLVGGNSAVANLLARLLGHLAANPETQDALHREAIANLEQYRFDDNEDEDDDNDDDDAGGAEDFEAFVPLDAQSRMPLTSASIMETLRLASSPIVPHLSRYDTTIGGRFVPRHTMILPNVYRLNLSPDLWHEPYRFSPERFIAAGALVKPEYFFPFSYGRRSCLGYKMVNTIIFSCVANLLVKYRVTAGDADNAQTIERLLRPRGSIALPFDGSSFRYHLIPRNV